MDFGLKSYQTSCRNCVENTVQLSVFFFATFWILLLQKTPQYGHQWHGGHIFSAQWHEYD
jgi:hypothetical protein